MLGRAIAVSLALGVLAGKDEGCSSFGMTGFSDPQLKDKWWARHPKLTLNGLPTYWTGASQNSPNWESTGLLFVYWCNIGSGGWYIEGNDIAKRERIFTNGDCSGIARRSDANQEIQTGETTWIEGPSDNPTTSSVTTSMCTSIQVDSCIAECKDLPTGIPFDTCFPLTACGSRSGMTTYVKIVTTEQDQKTWDTVTYQIYSDQNCTYAVAGRDDPPKTLRCDQCEPDLGNAMIPCTAMQDLKPKAESSNGVFMGIALTLLLLAIMLLVFYCHLRGNHEKLKNARSGWQNAREMREPLINENEEESPQEEVDALAEKIARYYEDSGKPMNHPCAEVAKLAMQQSDNPNQLLFNKLKAAHPEDRGLLADIFLGGLSSSPAANSPPSTPPEQRDVEEALVAAEANRKAREAEEYERQQASLTPPPPVEGKTKSKKKAGKTRPPPAAAVEENWDEPAAQQKDAKKDVEDWNDPPKAAPEENWDEPSKPAAVEEDWDEPAKKPVQKAAPADEEDWDEPAKKPESVQKAAPPADEDWDEPPPKNDPENWDEPAKAKPAPEENWDDAPAAAVVPKKSAKQIEDEDWEEEPKNTKNTKKAKPPVEEDWDEPALAKQPPAKKSADDEAWEDELPAPKKSPAKEESWDEPSAVPKKAAATAADEAWDEEPPKAKETGKAAPKGGKATADDEAWDDVPAAVPAKAKAKPSSAKDTEDNWEDETPAPKTKPKPKQKPQKDDEWEDEKVVLRKVDRPDAKKAADEEWDDTPAPAKKAPQPSKESEQWDEEPVPSKKVPAKSAPEESWDEEPTPSKTPSKAPPKASSKRTDEEEDWDTAEPAKAKGPGHVKKGQLDKWDEGDAGENFKNVKLRKTEKPENWDEGAGQEDNWEEDTPAPKTKKPAEESWDEEPAKKPAGKKDEAWEEEDNWEDSAPAKKNVTKKSNAKGAVQDDAWDEDGSELAGKLAARRAAEPADDGWVEDVEWDDAIDAADEDADWGDAPAAVVPTSPIEKEKHQNRQPTGLEVRIIEATNITGSTHNIQVLLASKGQRVRKTGVRDVEGDVVKWNQKFKMKLPENSLPMNLQFRVQHGRESIGETTLRLDDSSFQAGSDYLRKLDVSPQGTLFVEAAPMYYEGEEGGEMDDELQSILAKRRLQQESQN